MDIKREHDVCNSKPPAYQSCQGSYYIKQEIKVETEEIEIKREDEDTSYGFEEIFISQSALETQNEDSFNPVALKKEFEIKEEASFMYEDTTTEESSRNIKLEDIKHSTAEDKNIGYYSKDSHSRDIKNDIDIKDHSVVKKEEYVTKTLDGCIGQVVKSTNEKPKDIVKLQVLQKDLKQPEKSSTDKPFACEICKKRFTHLGPLDRHMRFHSSEGPFNCEFCQKTFKHKCDFNTHMQSERPFKCEMCGKKFMRKGSLKIHMKGHLGERMECEVCKKTFSQNGYLSRHMRLHTGEKLSECEVCTKKFVMKCDLDVHMRIHLGERPFECEVCKKKFISRGNMSKHLLIHSGDRPFECEVCKKNFISKGRLKDHMRVHSSERPYKCQICNKSFLNKTKLNRHTLIH